MTTQDITRHLLQPGKHYSAARMQQGRTVLDSDWNEDSMLESEDLRATLSELTGGQGSPNMGFSISEVQPAVIGLTLDFTIAPGSMYVGGLRVELEHPEQFLEQSDWPLLGADAVLPMGILPDHFAETPNGVRHDLVYLHVWEQTVSMVEDRELRERALGGPDTTTRVRRMRRVEVRSAVETDQADEAFAELVGHLESQGGTFDHANAELVSNARISVQTVTEDSASPCTSIFTGGYLGNEHQAIRVELRGPNTFTWGFCNAAPLYRVLRVGPANAPSVLEFITAPRDEVLWPRADQIVEVLPWSARIGNGEYTAALQGPMLKITDVDIQNRRITLDAQIPWAATAGMPSEGGVPNPYLYLRIWDRGPDTTSEVEIPFQQGVAVPLKYTGLQVTFGSSGRIGDHWVIAARKGVNARVLPWELLDEAAPHGTRHFYTPLAMIRWKQGEQHPQVRDIRWKLQPLCRGNACSITVGNGLTSSGQVNSLAAAVALLPTTGGRICLLPGEHETDVEITGRSNIEIVGCGPHSVLVNIGPVTPGAPLDTQGDPLLRLTNCTDIVLRNFALTAHAAVGVKITNSTGQSERIRLEQLKFTLTGEADIAEVEFALPQAAVLALGCNDLTITDCRVDIQDVLNYVPAIVAGGTTLRINRNWIQVGDVDEDEPAAMGGIHVLSQSSDVELVGNVIRRGWGNGITLGHVLAIEPPGALPVPIPLEDIWEAGERGVGEALVNHLNWEPVADAPIPELERDEVWCPLGAVTDLRICDNSIRWMSLSGISTMFVTMTSGLAVVVVVNAEIQGNDLVANALANRLPDLAFDDLLFGIGGIALFGSINANIRENVIREHGSGSETPVCGITALVAQNLVITDNRIVDNGVLPPPETTVPKGQRGGIFVMEVGGVRGYVIPDCKTNLSVPAPTVDLARVETALFIHRNEVSQRVGKALSVKRGFGPIIVTENSLHSMGDPSENMEIDDSYLEFKGTGMAPPSLSLPAQGACVEIINYATSSEVNYTGDLEAPIGIEPGASSNPDGRVMFNGNHTKLDWFWPGGYASSVLITSLDSIVANHNTMRVSMGNTLSEGDTFIGPAINPPQDDSVVFVNCWLGATSTIQASGNRFVEGLADAFLSLFVGDAIPQLGSGTCEVQGALLGTMNTATHCIVGNTGSVLGSNIVVFNNFEVGSTCIPISVDFDEGPPQTITITVTVA